VLAAHLDVVAKHRVSFDMVMRVLRVKTGKAHPKSGRGCVVTPWQVANVVGCSKSTVQRVNRLLRAVGLEVRVFEGRMLEASERQQAQASGSWQRGLASVVAFTIPAEARRVVDGDTPSSGTLETKKTKDKFTSVQRYASGMKAGATRRPNKMEWSDWAEARRLASELAERLPWLAGEATKRVLPCLLKFARAQIGWNGADIAEAINIRNRRLCLPVTIDPARIRTRKAAVLAHLVRSIDPYTDHPAAGGPLRPCGHPNCDGAGWRLANTTTDRGMTYHSYTRCPKCPPELRQTPLPHHPAKTMEGILR
jgi:hypothetical protein